MIRELKKGIHFTTPTRVELINTRVRFNIYRMGGTPVLVPPAILFHPTRSITCLMVTNSVTSGQFANIIRSGISKDSPLWDWTGTTVTDPAPTSTVTHNISAPTFGAAEAIGVPSTLVSPLTRVTGAVLTVKITCGSGTSGYMAFSCPSWPELIPDNSIRDIKEAHATNPRVRRIELTQGTITHHFIAPLTNPPALEVFEEANPRFVWNQGDPFGGTLITFHDIAYNENVGVPPVVELYATVGLQCRLEIADRHLASNHASTTKQAKEHINAGGTDGSPHIEESVNGQAEHVTATLDVGGGKP